MEYGFFPGCVLQGAAAEAYTATIKIAQELGIKLIELPGWTCCGASHLQDVDEMTALTVNARNIALAEKLGLPLLTVCSTCTLMLRKAKVAIDSELRDEINKRLAVADLEYRGTSEVTHLLWALINDYGLEKLGSQVVRPLEGLKVAGYYGCHLLRPPDVMRFEDHVKPRSLQMLIKTLGAEYVDFDAKLKCCGFHATFSAEKDVHRMTGNINANAIQAGADCIVTPCPLCQMQLDMHQQEGKSAVKFAIDIPVLHLSQLVGLALGFTAQELGFERHVTDSRVLEKILNGL